MLQTQVNYWSNVEQARHNRVMEEQGFQNIDLANRQLQETYRHNVTTEGFAQSQINEQSRHNRVTENLTGQQIDVQRQSLQVQKGQLALGFANLSLDQSKLQETHRSNVANENIRYKQAQASLQQASASSSQAAAAMANANTNRINALNNVTQNDRAYQNTKYANTTARMNAITNEKNATIREMELVNKQRETNIKETEAVTGIMNTLSKFIPHK